MATSSSAISNFTTLAPPVAVKIAPIGYWYIQHQILKGQHQTEIKDYPDPKLEKLDENVESSKVELVESEIDLALLDPTAWKSQDHYKLLGLSQIRFTATTDDIKSAYRKKAKKHHPDKLGKTSVILDESDVSKELSSEDKHFQCIIKAYEILSNPVKRRAYDSVDPTFDESIPDAEEIAESNFFDLFAPVFQRNSHFSIGQPVPQLGDNETPYSKVDDFYQYWFSFKSWREFSYLDDEDTDPDKAENREERRWLEKQNKQGRTQLKKNETHRVKKLVELAFNSDPRVRKADNELKQKKEEEKKAKQEKQAREQEEKDRRKREKEEKELKEREEKAEMERLQEIEEKRQREEKKQALKRQRSEFMTACGIFNNFSIAPADSASAELTQNIIDIENLCKALSIDELSMLTERIRKEETFETAKGIFEEQVALMNGKQEEEMKKLLSQSGSAQGKKKESKGSKGEDWSHEEIQLLIKAVSLHPGGTQGRWDVIANYINRHTPSSVSKSGKQVIAKVKSMQKFDSKDSARTDAQTFASFEKSHHSKVQASTEKTINYETSTAAATQWTSVEQKLLEEGLRAHPTSDPERWEKIAEKVGSRSEKECKKRFKEIVESLQAKKTKT